ncbi:MAG: hypothetical protein E7425_12105 [Ruminococcaceae bacterium]|nr:hypothetical protein [Oscillospiraceae bacterium]
MKHTKSKALSVLLTLVMLVGMAPWSVVPARAGGDETGTFTELQALLDATESGGTVTLGRDYACGGTDSKKTLEIASDKTVTLDLNGHVIKGSSSARVFSVSGSLTLTDSRPTFTGTESEPRAEVACRKVAAGSAATVTGGCITGGRSSSGNGGGVSVESGGAFVMNGGTICGNNAKNGGGVSVGSGCAFTMNGGAVSGNTAEDFSSGSGGGVHVDGGTFTMNGGEISGNAAHGTDQNGTIGGGGVYTCGSNPSFTMNGGVISGNLSGNVKSNGGGGVNCSAGTFVVSGSPVISGNVAAGAGSIPSNVYLSKTAIAKGVSIVVGEKGLDSGACIGVTTEDKSNPFTKGGKIYSDADASHFFSDELDYTVQKVVGANEAKIYSGAWRDSVPDSGGLYYVRLCGEYTSPITVSDGQYVTLDLYSRTVSGGIMVEDGGSLTIIDGLSGYGKITGSGVTVKGTLVLCGGKITGCSDGGVTVDGGTFVMEGGSITGNTAAEHGGGVYVKSGTFKVSGGAAITGNVTGGTIEDGVLSGGTAGNVCLAEGGKITVAGALTGTAPIGVTMETPGVFTSDLAKGGVNAISRFAGDDGDYSVFPSGNGEAALVAAYDLWVGGMRVVENSVSGTGWSYDATQKTLTLNGFRYSGSASVEYDGEAYNAAILWLGRDELKVELKGTNTVTETVSGAKRVCGICSRYADLTFTGTGSLSVTGSGGADQSDGSSGESCGVYCDLGGMTVSGGATVSATGGEATGEYAWSDAVYCSSLTVVGSGSRLTATGGKAASSHGVFCTVGKMTVKSGAALVAAGGNASSSSYGVRTSLGSISVEDSATLDATGSKATLNSYGIYHENYGNISVSGGAALTAGGGTAEEGRSCGVSINSGRGSVTVSGEGTTLTATGGSTGVQCPQCSVTVESGATLTATGNTDYGVSCPHGSVTVKSGATLLASGEEYAIYCREVTNAVAGMGLDSDGAWQNIAVSETARELTCKKASFPALTVTRNANGGTPATAAQSMPYGFSAALTANTFTRAGYAFAGWNTKQDGTGTKYADKASLTLTKDTTLYAQWKLPAVQGGTVYAPAGAVLVVASYDGGRMTWMRSVAAPAGGWSGVTVQTIAKDNGFTLPSSYKLMLVDGKTFAPLCEAWTK